MSVTAITQLLAEPAPTQDEPTRPDEVKLERATMATTALEDRAQGSTDGEWLAIALTEMGVAALS